MSDGRLRMVLATPLGEDLCIWIERTEPRIDLVRDHTLLPPMRHPGDHDGDPRWRRTPAQQERFDRLVDSAEALYGIPDVQPRALARTARANPQLRWVQTMAAGGATQVEAAGLTRAELGRIRITTAAGVHVGPLAEFALLGLLAGAKGLPQLLADTQASHWSERRPMSQLAEQTVVVVGLGSLGRELAQRLTAFGTRVVGVNRTARVVPGVERCVGLEHLADVARNAHALVVCLPDAPGTRSLVDAQVLSALGHGATVVNVGRGAVIDEDALYEALVAGRVGFAVLDVAAVEPLPASSPLWARPDVLISPHTAALSQHEDRRIAELTTRNATRLLDGLPMHNVLTAADMA